MNHEGSYKHGQKTAVLIVNLGTPLSSEVSDVRKYLNEFLMDPYVIDMPYLLRLLLVKGVIVPFRASKSAKRYQLIEKENEDMPLLYWSHKFYQKLIKICPFPIELAMRYGVPSIEEAVQIFATFFPDLSDLIVCPMYPQYSLSATYTAIEKVRSFMNSACPDVRLNVVPPFYNHPSYISVLSDHLKNFLDQNKVDFVLFSYHGLPVRHIRCADPTGSHCFSKKDCCSESSFVHQTCYYKQSLSITQSVAKELNFKEGTFKTSFQSRLGTDKWLTPDTECVLRDLAQKGVLKVAVICPSFVCDCLETLEEIEIAGRDLFRSHGGEELFLVPCLNDEDRWVQCYNEIILDVTNSQEAQ